MVIERFKLGKLPKKHWWKSVDNTLLPAEQGNLVYYKDIECLLNKHTEAAISFIVSYQKHCRVMKKVPSFKDFKKWLRREI